MISEKDHIRLKSIICRNYCRLPIGYDAVKHEGY